MSKLLDMGITTMGQARRAFDKYGKRVWQAVAPDVAKGKDPLSKTKGLSGSKGVSSPKGADSNTKRTKTS